MGVRKKQSSFGRFLLLMLGFLCLLIAGVWLFSSCGGAVQDEPPAAAAPDRDDGGAAEPAEPQVVVDEVREADVLPDESDFDGANNEVGSFAG